MVRESLSKGHRGMREAPQDGEACEGGEMVLWKNRMSASPEQGNGEGDGHDTQTGTHINSTTLVFLFQHHEDYSVRRGDLKTF